MRIVNLRYRKLLSSVVSSRRAIVYCIPIALNGTAAVRGGGPFFAPAFSQPARVTLQLTDTNP